MQLRIDNHALLRVLPSCPNSPEDGALRWGEQWVWIKDKLASMPLPPPPAPIQDQINMPELELDEELMQALTNSLDAETLTFKDLCDLTNSASSQPCWIPKNPVPVAGCGEKAGAQDDTKPTQSQDAETTFPPRPLPVPCESCPMLCQLCGTRVCQFELNHTIVRFPLHHCSICPVPAPPLSPRASIDRPCPMHQAGSSSNQQYDNVAMSIADTVGAPHGLLPGRAIWLSWSSRARLAP